MPTGIILTSASKGATQEAVQDVLEKNGLTVEKPEVVETTVLEEPKRDDFETDEEFEAAQEEHTKAVEEAEEARIAAERKGETEEEREAREEKEREAEEERQRSKPSRRQRAIAKATEQLRREKEDLQKRVEALERGEKPKKADEPPKDPNPRPLRADFDSQEKYEDALVSWGTKKALSEKEMQAAADAQKQQLEENWNNYRAGVEEFRDAHDDWDDVVNQDLPMHIETQLAIMEQENGAAVIYYLGTHPEYTKKVAEMSPLSAVMEVGRLSARLKTGSQGTSGADSGANHKPRSKVPAPVRPVNTATVNPTLTSREAAKNGNFKAFKAAQRSGR